MMWNCVLNIFLLLTVYVITGIGSTLHNYTYPDSSNQVQTNKNHIDEGHISTWLKKVIVDQLNDAAKITTEENQQLS